LETIAWAKRSSTVKWPTISPRPLPILKLSGGNGACHARELTAAFGRVNLDAVLRVY
jgi:hypothetical protein